MFLTYVPVAAMAMGLFVHARNLQMAECTLCRTIAWHESTRAAEFGLLITVLAAPWLIRTAILLHSYSSSRATFCASGRPLRECVPSSSDTLSPVWQSARATR